MILSTTVVWLLSDVPFSLLNDFITREQAPQIWTEILDFPISSTLSARDVSKSIVLAQTALVHWFINQLRSCLLCSSTKIPIHINIDRYT